MSFMLVWNIYIARGRPRRRSSRRSRASARRRKPSAVAAVLEEHRLHALESATRGNKPDQDPVVARLDGVAQRTDGVGRHIVSKNRPADLFLRAVPFQSVELVGELGRHASCDVFTAGGEGVGGEATAVM